MLFDDRQVAIQLSVEDISMALNGMVQDLHQELRGQGVWLIANTLWKRRSKPRWP
jgi:hypothetical protein